MYFPGDPLFVQDPIFNSVRDPTARRAADRPRSTIDRDRAGVGAGYEFDIVLRGRERTPFEDGDDDE